MPNQLEQVAVTIAEQLSHLLSAQVSVLSDEGIVITTSQPIELVTSFNLAAPCLHIPLQVNGRQGEVLIKPLTSEVIALRPAQMLVELMVGQAIAATQLANQQELKHKFIHDLLHSANASEINRLREGQILGMDLTRPRAVILIDAADYILTPIARQEVETSSQILQRAQFVINSVVRFFHLPSDTICAYIGNGEIAVLKASRTQDLTAWTMTQDKSSQINSSWANLSALKRAGAALLERLRADTQTQINIAIGRYHPTLSGLAASYQDARAALSLGKRFCDQNQVHCLDALGIAAFVGISHERTKIDLAKYLLSPLDQETELLETLNVFFLENCSLSTTASRLSIHRNTLSYRLEKITLLTGLDPRRFADAVQIRLALFLRSLQSDPPVLCKCPISDQWDQQNLRQRADESFNLSLHHSE